MNENYRIIDKSNANIGGKPVTTFKLYKNTTGGFVYEGSYSAPRRDASDEQCLACALYARDQAEYGAGDE